MYDGGFELTAQGGEIRKGEVHGPFDMRQGMNRFLKGIGITFRRDEETKRPRVNKLGSQEAEGGGGVLLQCGGELRACARYKYYMPITRIT